MAQRSPPPVASRVATRASSPRTAALPAGAAAAVVLSQLARLDRRIVVLSLNRHRHWRDLAARFPDRAIVATADESRGALTWTAALAELGAHVFIVLDTPHLLRHAVTLSDRVCVPIHRVTLVVETGRPSTAMDPLSRLVPHTSRRFEPRDGDDFARLVRQCMETAGPTTLLLPRAWYGHGSASDHRQSPTRVMADVPARAISLRPNAVELPGVDGSDGADDAGCDADLEREYRQIQHGPLTTQIQAWIDAYRCVGGRDLYLWHWTVHAIDLITLSCVDAAWRTHVGETKFLAAMFNVLLDDVADRQRQPELLRELMKLTRDGRPCLDAFADDRAVAELACRLWDELWLRVSSYPRSDEFVDLLRYDLRQLCNTIEYSSLIHHNPALINPVEHDLYSSHGMMVACAATLDLMCSPSFRTDDVGTLREGVWHAGCMARIGNLLTTWEREIADNDFSSGVFAQAVGRGWLRAGDLSAENGVRLGDAIRRHRLEQDFVDRWSAHRACLCRLQGGLTSVNVARYVEGLDRLFRSELASRGRK